MPSNPDSMVSFRDTETADYLDSRQGREQRHQQAKWCLQRYQLLMEQTIVSLGFTLADALAIWSELNGSSLTHAEMLPVMKLGVISALKEDGNSELASKLEAFSLVQWLAVVDACDRVGAGAYTVDDIDGELKRVFEIKG